MRVVSRVRLVGTVLLAVLLGTRSRSLPTAWLRNQAAIAYASSFSTLSSDPVLAEDVSELELSVQGGSGPANGYRWLGKMHLARTEYPQAEAALERALAQGVGDSQTRLDLARSRAEQQRPLSAIGELLQALSDLPFDQAVHLELQALYDQLKVRYEDRTGWTDVPHGQIAPRHSLSLQLTLPSSRPRWLRIFYFDYPQRDLSIMVDGQAVGEIRGTGDDWRTQRFLVPVSAGDVLEVELTNLNASEAFALTGLGLEYVANAELYADVHGSSWTDQSHKRLGPNERFETLLHLDAEGPRTLIVRYFDYPDRDLVVLVDDVELAHIVGGQHYSGQGGWRDFAFPLAETTAPLFNVTLLNPSSREGTAIAGLAVVEGPR